MYLWFAYAFVVVGVFEAPPSSGVIGEMLYVLILKYSSTISVFVGLGPHVDCLLNVRSNAMFSD